MMPYEVGKTFIIRVPLLSIETYKELCSEKDGLPVIKTKETLTGYTHKLFTLRRKKGTEGAHLVVGNPKIGRASCRERV